MSKPVVKVEIRLGLSVFSGAGKYGPFTTPKLLYPHSLQRTLSVPFRHSVMKPL